MIKKLFIYIQLLLLSSCLVNPHDKEEFNEFIFENISLVGNLVFYHFNEPFYDGTNGEVIDSSGLSKNSTSINSPRKIQGIYGEGVYCDGTGTGIDLQPAEFDDAFTKRTIAIWFRAESTTGTSYIYEEGGGTHGIVLYIQDGFIYAGTYRDTGGTFSVWLPHPIEIDRWYHAVIIFDSDEGFKLYIDGKVVSGPVSLGGNNIPSHSDDNGLCLQNNDSFRHDVGRDTANDKGFGFIGVIDELAVWNRVLSNEEVIRVYKRQGRL